MIRTECPHCSKVLVVKESLAGKRGKCPGCGGTVSIRSQRDTVAETETNFDFGNLPANEPPSLPARGKLPDPPRRDNQTRTAVRSPVLTAAAVAIVFAIGFLAGREQMKYQIRTAMADIASNMRKGLKEAFSNSAEGKPQSPSPVAPSTAEVPQTDSTAPGDDQSPPGFVSTEILSTSSSPIPSSIPEKRPTPSEKEPPVKDLWESVGTSAKLGDILVSVDEASLDVVRLKSFQEGTSKDKLLQIRLNIQNLSENRKIEYSGWGGGAHRFDGSNAGHLQDDFGNLYKRINFGIGTRIVGQVESESIYPGKMISDVLVFEEPTGTAKYLKLELPAIACSEEGTFRIKIHLDQVKGTAAAELENSKPPAFRRGGKRN